MTEAAAPPRHQPRKPRREKRPPLTHFLCLPLVNSGSILQLESSLAAFKKAHLSGPGSTPQTSNYQADTFRLGLPSSAFRPLGTLHLTLGVMSLPTKERLDQALSFFQSLDLAGVMSEAEQVSAHAQQDSTHNQSSPFTVSLESLHALPRGKEATVLHASPMDPTGRLLPFCVKLRDKFIDAGFIQIESNTKSKVKDRSSNTPTQEASQSSQPSGLPINESLHLSEKLIASEPPSLAENTDPSTVAVAPKPKPRPLLLHATLVNTIYIRGRQNYQNKTAKGKDASKRITFDARNLLAQYRHYYSDETRTIPHMPPVGCSAHTESNPGLLSSAETGENNNEPEVEKDDSVSASSSVPPSPGYPFIWAREIPLDTVCICEMGARKLDPGVNDRLGLNERLGEQYTVVAERSLLPVQTAASSLFNTTRPQDASSPSRE
jgi:activating signal cointegrator complex subunit 1